MLGTGLAGKRIGRKPIEFAEPLQAEKGTAAILDRFGLWFVLAAILVVAAYAWPIAEHLSMERFGSPGFAPF